MAPESFQWEEPFRTVDPRSLEQELDRLFREHGARTRATMLNLLAVCGKGQEVTQVMEALAHLVRHHPARVLVLDRCGTAPGVEARVTALCHRPLTEGPQVCCEVVTLCSRPEEVAAPVSVALSLLVPDLPVILWWVGSWDPEDPLLVRLLPTVDGLILDLDQALQWPGALAHPLQWLEGGRLEWMGDLTWYRLAPWREALATLFETQDRRRLLEEATLLHLGIAEAARPGWTAPGGLLLAWMKRVLGWRLQTPLQVLHADQWAGKVRAAPRSLMLRLQREPVEEDQPPGLRHLFLQGAAGGLLQVEWDGKAFQVRWERGPWEPLILPSVQVQLARHPTAPLCQALEEVGQGDLYLEVLRELQVLLGHSRYMR